MFTTDELCFAFYFSALCWKMFLKIRRIGVGEVNLLLHTQLCFLLLLLNTGMHFHKPLKVHLSVVVHMHNVFNPLLMYIWVVPILC